MDEHTRNENDAPARASDREPAEGSRESVRNSGRSGGITNRGFDREMTEQQQLPERGRSQDESFDLPDRSGSER